ncbi:MAG: hypothetical protein KGI57_00765 [Hyphomicrobiales bacterium]|nr:hypothetical protein [Hyphomicrobiales bacterium]MDE2016217.1 hypothetical protein [Hyphomicrobiales bacterium]
MGELVSFETRCAGRERRTMPSRPAGEATILFFTGVRYERMAPAPDPNDPPRLGAPGGQPRGRRRRAS